LKFVALTVLYKTAPENSSTVNSIIKAFKPGVDVELIIWDNSQSEIIDKNIDIDGASCRYIANGTNESLSVVYNTIIQKYKPIDYDTFCLFDQDSNVPVDYFDLITQNKRTDDECCCSLSVPIVKSIAQGLTISPGFHRFVKGKYWFNCKPGIYNSKGIIGITSGLAITKEFLARTETPFCEKFEFYCIDTDFFLRYSKLGRPIRVIDIEMWHGHSMSDFSDRSNRRKRFKKWSNSWMKLHSDLPFKRFLCFLYLIASRFVLEYRLFKFRCSTNKSGLRTLGGCRKEKWT